MASKDTTSLHHQKDGTDDFSEEYERVRAQVDLERRCIGLREEVAEGPSGSIP